MNQNAKKAGKKRLCPQCNKRYVVEDSTLLPFCSKRCKMIDLGHWLSEKYVVEEKNPSDKKDNKQD